MIFMQMIQTQRIDGMAGGSCHVHRPQVPGRRAGGKEENSQLAAESPYQPGRTVGVHNEGLKRRNGLFFAN
jgi:hypothetical protein